MTRNRRYDIDTLRGISVISVIIFHVNNSIFPNGYLGVDLFFVISGYVITKSILKNLKDKTFTFSNFYLRRAKRILPTLLVVLLFSLIAGAIILLTADLKRFTESLISSLVFISNFYFWLTGGYFSTNDQLKPLLHLWSLSIEEQFYLFFPIFLYFLHKFFIQKKYLLVGVILISIVSFLLNLYFLPHSDMVFFLFPTRVWQFGIGATLALSPTLKIKNIWLNSFYLIFALFLILFNFYEIINYLPDATLMSIGLGLILFKSNNEKNFINNLFKFKALIFIGLISYSLYLWHWPIISFLKYIYVDGIPLAVVAVSLLLILSLSIFSWKFVEQPFLYKYDNLKAIKFILFCYILLIAIAATIIGSKNFPSRYDKFPNLIAQSINSTYDCPPIKYRKFENTYGCYINFKKDELPKNILFGNSHAYMYGWPFIEYLKNVKQNGLILQFSCLPYIDKNISSTCLKKARVRFNSIIKSKESYNVFIGLTWYSKNLIDGEENYTFDNSFNLRKKSLNLLINELEKNKKNVFLIGPIPQPNYDFASEFSRQLIFNTNKYKIKKSRKTFDKEYSEIINYYEKKLGKNFIQPHKKLCDSKNCFFADKKGALFSDDNHLSKYGAMQMLPLFHKKN
jgi:peptidoglycan/LPS O-acetylase OafA/YrhL